MISDLDEWESCSEEEEDDDDGDGSWVDVRHSSDEEGVRLRLSCRIFKFI